jgi:hypothetical protein
MKFSSNYFKYWISITLGTFVGAVLGPFLFPSGLSQVLGMGIWGSLGLVGVAVLLATVGYVAFAGTKSVAQSIAQSERQAA